MPELPPARKSRSNAVIIGSAAAVVAAVVATGIVVVSSRDDGTPPTASSATESVTSADVVAADEESPEEPAGDPAGTDPQVFGLSDTVTYINKVEVGLFKFARGTSGSVASSENTAYLKFEVRVKNGGSSTIDTTSLSVNCAYGEDGHGADLVIDTDRG
ncbi:hypothetical protein [Streptomyces sp. NPDC056938]|uniref:hypothetical protein n=1 Tax=unclassified Streptomyces TaxID=2593676 RepID=UPI00362C6067